MGKNVFFLKKTNNNHTKFEIISYLCHRIQNITNILNFKIMAENMKKQKVEQLNEEQLNEEQLNEVAGGKQKKERKIDS